MIGYDFHNVDVLLVEKYPQMRRLLRGMLQELGISRVRELGSPDKGWEEFIHSTPDIVITDWAPGLDGINLVERIRKDATSPAPFTPIIVLTAYNRWHHVMQARDAGITEYLTKPISARNLYAKLASVVKHTRPFVRAGAFFGPDRRRSRGDYSGPDRRSDAPD